MDTRVVSGFPPPVTYYLVLTDALGRYEFRDVHSAPFVVEAFKDGYVLSVTQGGGCPRTPELRLLPMHLMPAGAISGRVTDDAGRPLEWARVYAKRVAYGGSGPRLSLNEQTPSLTDDRGDYRFFGLKPGKYVILVNYAPLASPHDTGIFSQGPESSLEIVYPQGVFYPGTRRLADAKIISVTPGRQISGVDFRLHGQRGYQISGSLSGIVSQKPKPSLQVGAKECGSGTRLLPVNPGVGGAVAPDGRFLLTNVLPGCYDLVGKQFMAPPEMWERVAWMPVTVSDRDIEGLRLQLARLPDVPVKIQMEGTTGHPDLFVFLENQAGTAYEATRGPGNGLLIPNVPPGLYRADVQTLRVAPGAYVKSVRLGTRNVLAKPVQILPGDEPGSLTILIAGDGASLQGSVVKADGKPDAEATVVLVPDAPLRHNDFLYKATNSFQNGHFTLDGIRPGRYSLFAWDKAAYRSWFDPSLLKAMAGDAMPIELAQGQQKTVQVRSVVIPISEGGLP